MAKIHINNPKQVINGGAKKYYFKVKGLGGPKGDKGDKGDTGATGPQGPQGNAATVSVGSTTTLPVGYDATVTNTGSIYNAVLDFGIPQGPQGPQGAKGDKGDTGAKGDTGPRGPQGDRGTNATVTVGTTITTEPGTQAYAWNSSSNPSNAVINFNIPRGATGSQGPQGIQGPIGPAGADGESFTPVVVSSLPTTGDEGKLYLTPKAHTTQTATGNPITATVAEEAGAIESFQLDGDTYQQSYTGKNLLNYNTIMQTTLNGVTLSLADDGTITLNGTCSSDNTRFAFDGLSIALDGTYTLSSEVISGTITNATDMTKIRLFKSGYSGGIRVDLANTSASSTSSASGDYILNDIRIDNGVVLTNYKIKIQLEKSATATSFEPYVGGRPSPNPSYPQNINVVTGAQTISINGTNYPISLGSIELCKLGTYQDYIWKDGEDWKVHKATVSAIIDGSESWGTSGTNTFYVANIYSKIGNSIQSASTGEMYASHFTIADITSSNTLVGASLRADAAQNVSNLRIRLQDMSGGVAGFRQMLSAKKPSIYARRLTPTDTTITDQTLIAQLEAVLQAKLQASNTITNTATGTNLAGDMEISYYEYDPTNRYDKWLWLRANNAYEEFDEEGGGGGGGSITVDSALSTTSKNPVQNKVVTAAINSKVDSSSLATVATSGSYNDLSNKPTIPTIPTQTSAFTNNGSDGTSVYVEADELATVATSGSYNDLSNKPTIPTVNNGTLTIRQNGKTLGEFTANQSTNTTVNLTDNSSYSTSEVKTSATWINGKPIYKKTVNCGAGPNNTSKSVAHGISNLKRVIRFEGYGYDGSACIPLQFASTSAPASVQVFANSSVINLTAGVDRSNLTETYITLWYTKTTD